MTVKLLVGDVRDRIAEIPDSSVDVVMCSPPFLALRKYGADPAEMGSERTPADFLDALLELTQEFRRVLTPHGSIAIELGDTYSGSGGAGGDYNEGGLRDGQAKFSGSASRSGWHRGADKGDRTGPHLYRKDAGAPESSAPNFGNGWPLAKSLTLIPTLYPASLAYGYNMLNPAHTFPRWRVRNVIVWARPNPPVGALGDKVRPATSYITVACVSAKRWFDLDAVRTEFTGTPARGEYNGDKSAGRQQADGSSAFVGMEHRINTHTGAPPLDWWDPLADRINAALAAAAKGGYSQEDLFGGEVKVGGRKETKESAGAKLLREAWMGGELSYTDDALTLPTQPYPGAHYATWPATLAHRLISMLCPLRVCVECGEPSRRIVDVGELVATPSARMTAWDRGKQDDVEGGNAAANMRNAGFIPNHEKPRTTTGWSDCGCECSEPWWSCIHEGAASESAAAKIRRPHHWRPGHILDPFAGSGTTLAVAQGLGRDATGIELYPANADLCRDRIGMFLTVDEGVA